MLYYEKTEKKPEHSFIIIILNFLKLLKILKYLKYYQEMIYKNVPRYVGRNKGRHSSQNASEPP